MNKLSLSNDLAVITAEINNYKQVAGQSIFEIGKRLKYVKENDLVHGEFGKWLESIEMSHTQANRFMKVYEELPNSELTHVGQIGLRAEFLQGIVIDKSFYNDYEQWKYQRAKKRERELEKLKNDAS